MATLNIVVSCRPEGRVLDRFFNNITALVEGIGLLRIFVLASEPYALQLGSIREPVRRCLHVSLFDIGIITAVNGILELFALYDKFNLATLFEEGGQGIGDIGIGRHDGAIRLSIFKNAILEFRMNHNPRRIGNPERKYAELCTRCEVNIGPEHLAQGHVLLQVVQSGSASSLGHVALFRRRGCFCRRGGRRDAGAGILGTFHIRRIIVTATGGKHHRRSHCGGQNCNSKRFFHKNTSFKTILFSRIYTKNATKSRKKENL